MKNNNFNQINCGIYQIRCLLNNNKIYIGSSKNIEKRYKDHLQKLSSGTCQLKYLQKCVLEYGIDNFVFEILKEVKEENLGIIERQLIIEKNSIHPNGLNGSLGGETGRRGYKMSQKEKEDLSLRMKGENNPNYGHRWSDKLRNEVGKNRCGKYKGVKKSKEHKQKISESNIGKHDHHGINNPKCKIDDKKFSIIKKDIIKLYNNEKLPLYKIEEVIAEKYQYGTITIRRIIYGKHYLTYKFGCLENWKNNK